MESYPVVAFTNYMLGKEFIWGKTDCNPVILQFLDMVMKDHPEYESITHEMLGMYDTPKSAYDFYKKFRIDAHEFLLGFCDINPETPTFRIGDIIIVDLPEGIVASHICVGGESLSMDPKQGAVMVSTPKLLKLDKVTVYRPRR